MSTAPELMKLIFAVSYVSWTMGLTRCYKTERFFTFIVYYAEAAKHKNITTQEDSKK